MMEMSRIDELSYGNSFLHYRHPLLKLLLTIVYIVTVMSFGNDGISFLLPMILIPLFLFLLAEIPVSLCFYKLRIVLPFVFFVGIANIFFDREVVAMFGKIAITSGFLSFICLLLKGTMALMMSFLLIATTSMEKICYALSLLHIPDVIISILLVTYRYIGLLLEETGNMNNAYSLRAPGSRGIHISSWGSFLGCLLLRSMDRAKELSQSMELRGFDGSFRFARVKKTDALDYLFFLACLALIVMFRCFDISLMIGRIFV